MTGESELAVIGGGLAGTALALAQRRRGTRVTLFEREAGAHDKVCGEFLSGEAVAALRDLGLDPERLGAVPVERVRVFSGGRVAETPLPFRGAGLSRRVLDEALLGIAAGAGVCLRRGQRVSALRAPGPAGGEWELEAGAFGVHRPAAVALATGKHDLRGWKRPAGVQNRMVGFKTHLRPGRAARDALDGTVELHLFPGGYVGLQPVAADRVNLCLVAPRELAAGGWAAVLAAAVAASAPLARRLDDAEWLLPRPLAISGIPYGLLGSRRDDRARPVLRLGDQFAVIPSLTGDGMAIALHSAREADRVLAAGVAAPAAVLAGTLRRDLWRPVRLATLLSVAGTDGRWQRGLGMAFAAMPGLAARLAAATRVPERAVRRAWVGAGRAEEEKRGAAPDPAKG